MAQKASSVEKFIGRVNTEIHTRTKGKKILYRVLRQFKFSSKRRCSSIVIRNPEGYVYVYVKGAEETIKQMLAPK